MGNHQLQTFNTVVTPEEYIARQLNEQLADVVSILESPLPPIGSKTCFDQLLRLSNAIIYAETLARITTNEVTGRLHYIEIKEHCHKRLRQLRILHAG